MVKSISSSERKGLVDNYLTELSYSTDRRKVQESK